MFSVYRNGPRIPHLLLKLMVKQTKVVNDKIQAFCQASGQKVSVEKSVAFCSPYVPSHVKNDIQCITGIRFTEDLGWYLGVSLITGRSTKRQYKYIIEKVQNRISNWKSKNISLAGQCTFIQFILSGVLAYAMQTAWLPQATCDTLNKLSRNFLWGTNSNTHKLHLVKWSTVTKTKKTGGLGIREARHVNSALVAGVDKVWS